jgi:hypothetical protein
MKTYGGVEVYLHAFLTSALYRASGHLHPQGESPWYSLDRRLCASQSWSGSGKEKKSLPLLGIEPRLTSP